MPRRPGSGKLVSTVEQGIFCGAEMVNIKLIDSLHVTNAGKSEYCCLQKC